MAPMMLIPPSMKTELTSDYRENECQQQSAHQKEPQKEQQDCEISSECSTFRPKKQRKPASEGFSTPPVSAFKAPHSGPPSMSHSGMSTEDLQGSRAPYYYGSPEAPEADDLEFDTTKGKVTLWQFLLQLLLDPRYSDIIRWTNNAGEFVLLRAEKVARLWGLRKDNNHRMNYDKLSRALRYYYQKNIIRKVQGHKFVYQFIGLHRLKGLIQTQCLEKSTIESIFSTESLKSQRQYSNTTKPLGGMSSESCFNGFTSFRHSTTPFLDPFNNPQSSKSPQMLSSNHFGQLYPTNLSQSIDLRESNVATTSQTTHSFQPINSYSSSDLSRLYSTLHKNGEKSHFPTPSEESLEAMATLACKSIFQALPPSNRTPKRSLSPDCRCSCHASLTPPQKVCEDRHLHFNSRTPNHSGQLSPVSAGPLSGHRKPRSADCWSSISGSQNNDVLPLSDHRSFLHWQRHMINMNRLKEQIQRVSGVDEERKPTIRSPQQSQSIFRPFDVPQSESDRSEDAMEVEARCDQDLSSNSSSTAAAATTCNGNSNSNGNYIWMPIQVDLVEHFMTMLSQTLQDRRPKEPPMAHSSPRF